MERGFPPFYKRGEKMDKTMISKAKALFKPGFIDSYDFKLELEVKRWGWRDFKKISTGEFSCKDDYGDIRYITQKSRGVYELDDGYEIDVTKEGLWGTQTSDLTNKPEIKDLPTAAKIKKSKGGTIALKDLNR